MMEDMDIDQVVEIPDTPDRPAARHINTGNNVGKESKLLLAQHSRNSDVMDEEYSNRPRARGWSVGENGNNTRLTIHHWNNPSNADQIEHRNNSAALAASDIVYASKNASLFRKADKNPKHETRNSIGAKHMDKGKRVCSKFPSKSSTFQKDNAMVDLTEQNGQARLLEMAFPHGKLKDLPAKDRRDGQIAPDVSSLHWPSSSSKTFRNSFKGKEKIEENASKGADSFMDCGKRIELDGGSQHNNVTQMSASHHSVDSPRVCRQKRLVRNGCISPHNIELRSKQIAERSQNCSKDVEQNHSRNVVSSGPSMLDVRSIVAEDGDHDRFRWGTTLSHTLKEHDPKFIPLSSSSVTNNEEVDGNSHASRDALGSHEELGGWRSTRNRSKKVDQPSPDATGHHSRSNDDVECFVIPNGSMDSRTGIHYGSKYQNAGQTTSRLVTELDQISEPSHAAKTLTKRKKKHDLTTRNRGESSRRVPDESEIVFLGSPGESSRSRSSRIQSHRHQSILDIDELSPEMRHSDSQGMRHINTDDSDARARQVEADELLAVELQEQLYSELTAFGDDEIDESLAWTLQQEEEALPFFNPNQNHRGSNPRNSSTQSYRYPQPRLLQNNSNRRGARARVHTPTGMTQFRNRFLNRPRGSSSRARSFRFPLDMDMDLDMRIDMLEALEAAFGDLTDIGTAGNIARVQRDFNESDYEMLLALDENNQQHGASVNQINGLPVSTVQTVNSDEACAICLDTPDIGETIRHLPCLHKFHKDCIDPWLNRRSSCPVCKSSVT